MKEDLYFDYNGSTPVHPRVAEVVAAQMRDVPGNAAAAHPAGRAARAAIQRARAEIARGIGARAGEVWCTSGGTESNNWALVSSARHAGRGHLVVSAIEHKSVLAAARVLEREGFDLSVVAPRADGRVDPAHVAAALRDDTFLVSLMLSNNETGVVQPAADVGRLCRERGVRFHTDAVCSIGRIPVDVGELGCDLLSLSSHKLYAPKGAGVLFVREGVELPPLIHGCGQQEGMRSGTENTPGVVGFGAAMELYRKGELPAPAELAALRDELWERIAAAFAGARRNGAGEVLPNTLNVFFPGCPSYELQAALGAEGASVAAGAAGSTGEPSHVLRAMGLPDDRARCSVRFSLGAGTSRAALERLVAALGRAVARCERGAQASLETRP